MPQMFHAVLCCSCASFSVRADRIASMPHFEVSCLSINLQRACLLSVAPAKGR